MIRLILILLSFGLVACNNGGHQSERVIIEDADYDFGLVPDTVQMLRHQFKIENVSSDTCRVKKIERSCGCTKVRLSADIIPPGETVYLDVNVDLGSNYSFFERDINIYMEHRPEPYTIFVRACRQVPKEMVEREFPVRISDQLRANMPYLIIGNCKLGDVKTDFLNISNQSDETVKYEARLIGAPACVSVFHDDKIPAGDVGRVIITTDLSKVDNDWGLHRYTLRLTSGKDSTDIPVEAIFVENVEIAEENPRIMMPFYMFTLDTKKKTSAKFVVKNVGQKPLVFKSLKPYENMKAKVSIGRSELPPQATDTITVTVDDGQTEDVYVGVSSNDPIEPFKELRVICDP